MGRVVTRMDVLDTSGPYAGPFRRVAKIGAPKEANGRSKTSVPQPDKQVWATLDADGEVVRAEGVEPSFHAWEAHVIAVILRPRQHRGKVRKGIGPGARQNPSFVFEG